MTPFTDDDLTRLKEFNSGRAYELSTANTTVSLWALLARLEAAEAIVKINECECRFDHHGYCQNHFLTNPCEYKAWRKAAGKK